MALVNVKVDTTEVSRALGTLNINPQVSLALIGEVFQTEIEDVIESEGGAGTEGSWEPFSPVTFKIHPRRVGGSLLDDTGQLANIQIETGTDWVYIGSPAPYAAAHIEGTFFNPWPNMQGLPSRDFLAIDIGSALDEAAAHVADEIVRSR